MNTIPTPDLSRRDAIRHAAGAAIAGAALAAPALADGPRTPFADDDEIAAHFEAWRREARALARIYARIRDASDREERAMPERPAHLYRHRLRTDEVIVRHPLDVSDLDRMDHALLTVLGRSPAHELALCRLRADLAAHDVACARVKAAHATTALDAELDATDARADALARRILETPARSVRGIAVKLALGFAWGDMREVIEGDREAGLGERMLISALGDAERVAGQTPTWPMG